MWRQLFRNSDPHKEVRKDAWKKHGSRDMGFEEGTGKEIAGRSNENATMNVRS